MGPSGWIGVSLADNVDWALVEARLASSWRLVAPRRLIDS
jgi:predicted DNA-binding protein (MmcQ/YjbR family)